MIKHPAKDPVSLGLGFLVTGILIFLAYQAVLLSDSLVKHRDMVNQMLVKFEKEIQENRVVSKENQEEIRQTQVVGKENQEEILRSRAVSKDNSATLKRTEERLLEIEQEIKRLHPQQQEKAP